MVSEVAKIPLRDFSPGCYNLVSSSRTVNDIADALNTVFPELEQVYINQDLKLNQLKAKLNALLNELADSVEKPFEDYLADFTARFTF